MAKQNRNHFQTMRFVIHYIIRWCRRRPELPEWLARDAGGSSRCLGEYRWLEQWLKEKTGGGGDWQGWQGGNYPGNFASSLFGTGENEDPARATRMTWCAEML